MSWLTSAIKVTCLECYYTQQAHQLEGNQASSRTRHINELITVKCKILKRYKIGQGEMAQCVVMLPTSGNLSFRPLFHMVEGEN